MDYIPTEIREVHFTDRMAVANNVATNGRLFCLMLFVAALVLHVLDPAANLDRIAALSILPVGASCVVDMMPRPIARVASLIVYAFAAVLVLILVFATFKG